jgi:hypothetical protein
MVVLIDTVASAGCSDTHICPILHEPFNDIELDIAKGKSFLAKQEDVCVATLPCGHRFSLLGIMYQFVLVDMRCPLCREGSTASASISHIPHAWRACMTEKKAVISQFLVT